MMKVYVSPSHALRCVQCGRRTRTGVVIGVAAVVMTLLRLDQGQVFALALPGQPPSLPSGLYPHLLRGAYRSGLRARQGPEPEYGEWEGQIVDVDPE